MTENNYTIRDTVLGVVTYVKGSRAYIELDNAEVAIANFAGLRKNDHVVCSVRHVPNEQHYFYFVSIDSKYDAVA